MTKREVLKNLERLKISSMACGMQSDNPTYEKAIEALNIAITALRGPTREQVEAWPGCSYCQEGAYSDAAFDVMCRGEEADFCKFCGRPLTDEAVDIVMKRLEELYETE